MADNNKIIQKIFRYSVNQIDNNFYEVRGLPEVKFDKHVLFYDKLVRLKIYNFIVWGDLPKSYIQFVENAVLRDCSWKYNGSNKIYIDIGCGPATFSAKAYAKAENCKIFLVDIAKEMLKFTQKRIKALGNDNHIVYLRADGFNLPFKDEIADIVVSFGTLHLFENPLKMLNEIYRVLKPGGRFYAYTLVKDRLISYLALKFLNIIDFVATPKNSKFYLNLVQKAGLTLKDHFRNGGMLYIIAKKESS